MIRRSPSLQKENETESLELELENLSDTYMGGDEPEATTRIQC